MTSITARQSTTLTEKAELLRSISKGCRHFKPEYGFHFALPTVALYFLKEVKNYQICNFAK